MPVLRNEPSPTFPINAVSSSEAASGQKSLTPLIAGSVCGGLMGIAYIIGFTVYFIKRSKRKKRKRAVEAGIKAPKPPKHPKAAEPIVMPPDPAVLFGQRQPGEHAFPDKHKHKASQEDSHNHSPHHSHTPSYRNEVNNNASTQSVERILTPGDSPATRPLLPSREIREAAERDDN
ncbi:hypothetical protein BDZ89DRAFT_1056980 [Hymenopellis radicata]|nr:hypothetical protein BDZ89DRAFT_1056980 [Hymenopellis radicata]